MHYSFEFMFEGREGMCMVHRTSGTAFVMWGGIGFQIEAARPELRAAISARDPEHRI